jgi:SAM-dependent methyltransferase
MDGSHIVKINSQAWDTWVDDGNEWSVPISHEAYHNAQHGTWEVTLTAGKPVPKDWFPAMRGAKVLGLACGGGQQCPIFKALGADVTVFDNSEKQLIQEQRVADRENYAIELVKGDMADLSCFQDQIFDLVYNPVSTCYVRDVIPVWNEVYRVLKTGGVFLTGFANPIAFIFSEPNGARGLTVRSKLPFDPIADLADAELRALVEKGGPLFFSHSLESLLGGQMRAGFRLLDLYEDDDPYDEIARYTPTYIATKAIRNG